MDGARRWVLIIVVGLFVVSLVAFARGPEHQRGPQQVGALGAGDRVAAVLTT